MRTCTVCHEPIRAYHNTAECEHGEHHLRCKCPSEAIRELPTVAEILNAIEARAKHEAA